MCELNVANCGLKSMLEIAHYPQSADNIQMAILLYHTDEEMVTVKLDTI